MLKKLPFEQIKALGIDLWLPKSERYTDSFNSAPEFIHTDKIIIHARCLVITTSTSTNTAVADIEKGMLGVLQLDSAEIMRVTISNSLHPNELLEQIKLWSPRNILQLDMQIPKIALPECIQTYSPQFLEKNTNYKAKAYKALLTLQARIHGRSEHSQNGGN